LIEESIKKLIEELIDLLEVREKELEQTGRLWEGMGMGEGGKSRGVVV
jgi:hypothetical protein